MREIGISCRWEKTLAAHTSAVLPREGFFRNGAAGGAGMRACRYVDRASYGAIKIRRLRSHVNDSRCRRDRGVSRFWGRCRRHFRYRNQADLGNIRKVCHWDCTESLMSETASALMDTGEANRRILFKDEYRADFRRVEIRTKLEEATKELN